MSVFATFDEIEFLRRQGFEHIRADKQPETFVRQPGPVRHLIQRQRFGHQWRCWSMAYQGANSKVDWRWRWGSKRVDGTPSDPALFDSPVAAFVYAETEEWGCP